MNDIISKLQGILSQAHGDIQNIVVQATAGNVSNIQSALSSIQYVYNELPKLMDIPKEKTNERVPEVQQR